MMIYSSNFLIELCLWLFHFFFLMKTSPFDLIVHAVGELFGYVRKKQPWADPKIVKVIVVSCFVFSSQTLT